MKQSKVVEHLNNFFHVQFYDESDGWTFAMDSIYQQALRAFATSEFLEGTWNGLMLDNAKRIERVYLVVFPTPNILDTIIAKEVDRRSEGALIFAHHLLSFEENGQGFAEIPVEQLEELQEHHISFYNCHAPLDCHHQISTGNALANALGLNDLHPFADYYGGKAGIIGKVPPIEFQKFAEKYAEVCDLPRLRYDQILHNQRPVERVAIIAGGGDDIDVISEAQRLGADTYITGHWHLFMDTEFAKQRRTDFAEFIPSIRMNLLGSSHYSSEMVVMRDQMRTWFADELGLEAILMTQDNPWGLSD